MIARNGFKDIPADHRVEELLYLQLKGGTEAVVEACRNPKETELQDLIEDLGGRKDERTVRERHLGCRAGRHQR